MKKISILIIILFLNNCINSQESVSSFLFNTLNLNNKVLTTKDQKTDSFILSDFDFLLFKPVNNKSSSYKIYYKNNQIVKISKIVNLKKIIKYSLQIFSVNKNIKIGFIYLTNKEHEKKILNSLFIFDLRNSTSFFIEFEQIFYITGFVTDNSENILYEEYPVEFDNINQIRTIIGLDKNLNPISKYNFSEGNIVSSSEIIYKENKIYEKLYIYNSCYTENLNNISLKKFYYILNKEYYVSKIIFVTDLICPSLLADIFYQVISTGLPKPVSFNF